MWIKPEQIKRENESPSTQRTGGQISEELAKTQPERESFNEIKMSSNPKPFLIKEYLKIKQKIDHSGMLMTSKKLVRQNHGECYWSNCSFQSYNEELFKMHMNEFHDVTASEIAQLQISFEKAMQLSKLLVHEQNHLFNMSFHLDQKLKSLPNENQSLLNEDAQDRSGIEERDRKSTRGVRGRGGAARQRAEIPPKPEGMTQCEYLRLFAVHPKATYVELIKTAILSIGRPDLTQKEICAWIEKEFAYFREKQNWQSSIRTNLSSKLCFEKTNSNSWIFNENEYKKMNRREFNESNYERNSRKTEINDENMPVEENLDIDEVSDNGTNDGNNGGRGKNLLKQRNFND